MAKYEFRYVAQTCGCLSGDLTVADDTDDLDGGGFYFDDGDDLDGTFTPNETVTLYDGFGADFGEYTYLGFTEDGLIIDFGGAVLYFGNRPLLQDDTIPFTADPLAVCFYPGTLIATPDGSRAVETLVAGDPVLTADGAVRSITWMGRQRVTTAFADPLRMLPVTIRAGALGDGLPLRDLTVSPDHALLIDGMLVHAGALVNGSSIVRMRGVPGHFTYWHIELADHALILAEGVAAETYLDGTTRRRFDNWAEAGEAPQGMPLDLPRVTSARALPVTLRRRLAGLVQPLAA